MKLLALLTEHLPPQAAEILMRVFYCAPRESVPFRAFLAAVRGCMLYVDYIALCEDIFAELAQSGGWYEKC